jgi:hypothetical protein
MLVGRSNEDQLQKQGKTALNKNEAKVDKGGGA